jgi:hypothetical protein
MSAISEIHRKPIPALPSTDARIGEQGSVRRSFDPAQGNPLRLLRGEMLTLTVEFADPPKQASVVCYTNLNRQDGAWRPLRFKRQGTVFRFSARAETCGVYGFRIKYTFNRGATWIWDRAPLVYVHVDPKAAKDIRCYTMLPTVSGKTDQWIDRLDHIKRLGFNMVHLLPVTRMDRSESPYSAEDLFSLDLSFFNAAEGADGLDELERFVVAAKARRLGLCIDLVLNHVGPGSLIGQRVPEWIMPDENEPDGMQRSGCWHMNQWLKWRDLVKIYYDHPNKEARQAIWSYMSAYALFWANYADYTGGMVRLDNLHNSDEDFIAFLLGELRAAYPNLVIHAELFSDANTVLRRAKQWDLNLFLANPWEHPYAEDLREYLGYCHDIGARVPHYMPVITHDTGAPAELFGSARAVVPRYFVTALMSGGQTGLVQGAEHGVPGKVPFIGRNRPFPYRRDEWIEQQITRINVVLASHECLHTWGNIRFVDGDHGAVIGAYRAPGGAPARGLLLFANLDTEKPQELAIDMLALSHRSSNELQDVLDNAPPVRTGAHLDVRLPPSGVAAYRILGEAAAG